MNLLNGKKVEIAKSDYVLSRCICNYIHIFTHSLREISGFFCNALMDVFTIVIKVE